jgi:hypothetical protein
MIQEFLHTMTNTSLYGTYDLLLIEQQLLVMVSNIC